MSADIEIVETIFDTIEVEEIPAGTSGANGAAGARWLHGAGVPGSGLGADGDFYLRDATGDVYTRTAGAWGAPIANLQGDGGGGAAYTGHLETILEERYEGPMPALGAPATWVRRRINFQRCDQLPEGAVTWSADDRSFTIHGDEFPGEYSIDVSDAYARTWRYHSALRNFAGDILRTGVSGGYAGYGENASDLDDIHLEPTLIETEMQFWVECYFQADDRPPSGGDMQGFGSFAPSDSTGAPFAARFLRITIKKHS